MNRREALHMLGTGSAFGFLGAVIVSTAQCSPTEAPAAVLDPLLNEMRDDPPLVTTKAGAIEALKLATNTARLSDPEIILALNEAVLAYLEGRA